MFIWCNEAPVHEIVPPERWKRSYLIRRALLRGQSEEHFMGVGSVGKSLVAVPLYALMLPFLALLGQHVFMQYVVRLMDHAGKLMTLVGLKPIGGKYAGG